MGEKGTISDGKKLKRYNKYNLQTFKNPPVKWHIWIIRDTWKQLDIRYYQDFFCSLKN